ncbi:MAG: ABC transporter permease [Ectothiorhodospiraceae bacterium]|nr:ABC transporter permease [Ectothiorhodospiraceae bacterium]
MILAILRVMWLGLLRDRGALAMAFILPPIIFVIFAAIFAGASGDEMRLRIVIADLVDDASSQALVTALQRDEQLRAHADAAMDEPEVRRRVRMGEADVGVVIQEPLAAPLLEGSARILVIADGGRAVAGPMVAGRLQALIQRELPEVGLTRTVQLVDILLDGYTDEQRRQLTLAMEHADTEQAVEPVPLVAQESLQGQAGSDGAVNYYAGAVAMLFLLFAAMQGAASLIDERQSGVVDRLLIGPGGSSVVVLGKGLFLVIQGVLQIGLIFLVAWLAYGVDLPGNFLPWLMTTLMAALAAAGLALALCVSCSTRQQAQTLSTFFVLILSAVGGSMVPRFMMPPWLQDLGWFTPNAWAIEAYQAVLWRGAPAAELLTAWAVLGGVGLAALGGAVLIAHRLART